METKLILTKGPTNWADKISSTKPMRLRKKTPNWQRFVSNHHYKNPLIRDTKQMRKITGS